LELFPHTFDPLIMKSYNIGCRVIKLYQTWAKSIYPWLSYWWFTNFETTDSRYMCG